MLTSPLSCIKCRAAMTEEQLGGRMHECRSCRTKGRATLFPAFLSDLPPSKLGTEINEPEQASCFHHETLSAEVACDFCGRFLCGLCDITFTDKHVCSACIERMALDDNAEQFTRNSTNWDTVSFWLGIIGIIAIFLGPLAVAAFFVARRAQKVAPKVRLHGIVGLVFGALETVAAISVVLMMIFKVS